MTKPFRLLSFQLLAVLAILSLLAACGVNDDPVLQGSPPESTDSPTESESPAGSAEGNACPVEGCRASIESVEKDGDELKLTFNSNYAADISRNHFHVFWDNFTPQQVSDNAERTYNVTQGDWEPTADNPYTTAGTVSTSVRGESTRVCVTPGDRDHNVIDPAVVECEDISEHL
ncbi:hypothetical protein BH23ACT12_BH23ACT12_07010 [soil metagenome]